MSINQADADGGVQVLDPCLLGRPVHLLPVFAARLADALGAAMAAPGASRYWGPYRLDRLEFARAPDDRALRWLGVTGRFGQAALAFERGLLLDLLEGRYARRSPGPHAALARDPGALRVTATEERLAATLARQVASLLDEQVAEGLAEASHAAAPDALLPPKTGAEVVPVPAPGRAGWVIRAGLRAQYGRRDTDDPGLAAPVGQCWIGLDQEVMAQVLQGLTAGRHGARGAAPRMPRTPLASRLQVRLHGRLVSMDITLGALCDLKVGDVIPIPLGRADVLQGDCRLFTAAVAEHQGTLCLTSFEDAESWT